MVTLSMGLIFKAIITLSNTCVYMGISYHYGNIIYELTSKAIIILSNMYMGISIFGNIIYGVDLQGNNNIK